MHTLPSAAPRTDERGRLGVVARAEELAAIERFLERAGSGPAALVFEGEPGIGKTTIWREVLERAPARGVTLLSCRPVEAEAKLAFASLADLVGPVADRVLPGLPDPQRSALDVALLRASPGDKPPSPRAVAAALLSSLRVLASESPVVLAIDDQQWLDRATADALAFALRRVEPHPVSVVAALRVEGPDVRDALALDLAFAGRIERRRLAPLGMSALHHVLRSRLGHLFPRPVLRRIADTSHGNPFFALEIARALLDGHVAVAAGEPLPVPQAASALVERRLARLPARTRAALLAVAACSTTATSRFERLLGRDDASSLVRAVQAGILDSNGGELRFTHPLLASAVYRSASPRERRALHERLAALVDDVEERARHLALAASAPDEDVALALDEGATRARLRGAPDAAGELAEQAAERTPREDAAARRRRQIQAAEHFFHAGDRRRARTLLDGVLAEGAAGGPRGRALHLLGLTRLHENSFADAIQHLEEALRHVEAPAARVALEIDLFFARFSAGDWAYGVARARALLEEAEQVGDPALLARALSIASSARLVAGEGCDRCAFERAMALEDESEPGLMRPTSLAGFAATYEGRLREAIALVSRSCERARERGEDGDLPYLLGCQSAQRCWQGDLAGAIACADEALLICDQMGSDTMRAVALAHRGRARARSGDLVRARDDLAASRQLFERTGYRTGLLYLLHGEAELELSLGDAAAAARVLEPLLAVVQAVGLGDPFDAAFVPDGAEALAALGDVARAAQLLDPFEARARALDRDWAIAVAMRARSTIAAARGDLDAALEAALEAVARGAAIEMPLDRGRGYLTVGRLRRRRGERRLAHEALERARTIFHEVGMPVWAERTEDELRRIPLRRSADDGLTATEERVALLAAAGRTNQQVARALFMSPKTVEANLSRVYAKLGIRSRAELGALMAERARPPARPQK
ncbi:MAG: AAA family ATPase [Thermodesulfobacteriota bacterium]